MSMYSTVVAGSMQPAGGSFQVENGAFFQGNDRLVLGSSPAFTNTKVGTIAFWYNAQSHSSTRLFLVFDDGALGTLRFYIQANSSGRLAVVGYNASGTVILNLNSGSNFLNGTTWKHVIVAFDMAQSNKSYIYFDGSDVTTRATHTNDTIDWTTPEFGVGGVGNGTQDLEGAIQQLYVNTDEFIDPTTNLSDLYDSGNCVDYGSDGSTPTGSQPKVYLKSTYDSFGTNDGSLGNLTEEGSIGELASAPC